jgi:SAM-dependent methyltransferase
MRTDFVAKVLRKLRQSHVLLDEDSILAVCAGKDERRLFEDLHRRSVLLTSLDPIMATDSFAPYSSRLADVRDLPFDAGSFDFVFVSDGLHHCDSPHAALVEMYRVAKKGVIVFESRDGALMRAAVRLGFTGDYEVGAVIANGGTCAGVNYTEIPNFVYRWTEREFYKVVACADPTGRPEARYYYGFNLPPRNYRGLKAFAYRLATGTARLLATVFRSQCNSFCMVALKPKELYPWLEHRDGAVRFRGNENVGSRR